MAQKSVLAGKAHLKAPETALVVGVGPGLGWALAKRFAAENMHVGAVARDEAKLDALIGSGISPNVRPYPADVSKLEDVTRVFASVERDLGEPDLVVFNAGAYQRGGILDIDPDDFARCWMVGCFAGFLVGQAAARRMVGRGHGTIIFTGATAALRGSAGFINLAVPKFGLRALAQSMARELGPRGIHVAFVVVDGQIESERYRHLIKERGDDSLLAPDSIAETYLQLHRQQRSAWTQELDVRPWSEKF
jgi:NAD(P)-dependent dehydrogenase (short-subunit alcohol dehydrogenase family)